MKITIIGLGLIGGSLAIDLRKRGFASQILGVDTNKLHASTAKNIGLVDDIVSMEDGVRNADLVIVATPVNITKNILPKILYFTTNQTVTDVCSTKKQIIEAVNNHPKRKNFVASHPMSGTENSGPWAAIPQLFDGKAAIICNVEDSSKEATELVINMYKCLFMRTIFMDANDHDIHAAYVSHISHISSFALALTVLEKEKNESNIFNLASGGFNSTVRLAKSDADMWAPIFQQNSENVLEVLETYINELQNFKTLLKNKDEKGLFKTIEKANKIRRII